MAKSIRLQDGFQLSEVSSNTGWIKRISGTRGNKQNDGISAVAPSSYGWQICKVSPWGNGVMDARLLGQQAGFDTSVVQKVLGGLR